MQVQGLAGPKRLRNGSGVLRIVAVPVQFRDQFLLPHEMPFTLGEVAFGLSQMLKQERAVH